MHVCVKERKTVKERKRKDVCERETCTGQAAASPRAQMVWPSIWREISSNMSISPGLALPTVKR